MKSVKTLLTIMLLTLFVGTVDAKEINVYMVYSEKCGNCQSAKAFFEEYTKDNKDIKLYKYNALDESTMDEIEIIEETINKNLTSVPLIVIGEKFLTGFNSTKEKQIKDTIKDYQSSNEANVPFIHASYGFGKVECENKITKLEELLDL